MAIPIVYRKNASPNMVNYDYIDISSGAGVEVYYGAITASGAAVASGAVLIRNAIYSQTPYVSGAVTTSDFTNVYTQSYDLKLNLPRLLYGSVIVNFPHALFGDTSISGMPIISLQKVDAAGATTLIVSGMSMTRGNTSAALCKGFTEAVELKVLSKTKIKKGEKIRFVCDYYVAASGAGPRWFWYVGHDPKARTSTDTGGGGAANASPAFQTQLTFNVPFVIT